MPTSSIANPYASTTVASDFTIPDESTNNDLEAYGPMTYQAYLDGTAPGARQLGFLFCVISLAVFLHVKVVFGWFESLAAGGVVGAITIPVLVFLRRFTYRSSFENIPKVRRWTISENGIRQDYANGESDFTAFANITSVNHEESVMRLVTENAVPIFIPRSAFSDDSDWQAFQTRASRINAHQRVSQSEQTVPSNLEADKDSILVIGPMNDEEAMAAYQTWRARLPFATRNLGALYLTLFGMGLTFALIGLVRSDSVNPFLISNVALFTLTIGCYFPLCRWIRNIILRDSQSIDQWRLNEHGIAFVKRNTIAEHNWRTFPSHRVEELGIYLFGPNPSTMVFVPRSGFQTKSDWERACELVARVYDSTSRMSTDEPLPAT